MEGYTCDIFPSVVCTVKMRDASKSAREDVFSGTKRPVLYYMTIPLVSAVENVWRNARLRLRFFRKIAEKWKSVTGARSG